MYKKETIIKTSFWLRHRIHKVEGDGIELSRQKYTQDGPMV